MSEQDSEADFQLSRRRLLAAAGLSGVAAGAFVGARSTEAAGTAPDPTVTQPVAGLHLQFGADAASQVVVSWHTLQPVTHPRVLVGRLDGRLEQTVEAATASYTDAKSSQVVYAHHAKVGRLRADTSYLYGALHDAAAPRFSTFRTAPRGRAAFTFTSFGDQGTPSMRRCSPRRQAWRSRDPFMATTISDRRPPPTPRWALNGSNRCSICSTATSATPIWPMTG